MNLNDPPHKTVLLEEATSILLTDSDGIYLDGTIGFGGHSLKIINNLSSKGSLIGMDLDPYALEYTQKRLSEAHKSYSLYHGNFREYPNILKKMGINKLTGILLDLGFSSSQVDTSHRGFSYQADSPLDMRYNLNAGSSAYEYLNEANLEEINKTIYMYGEEVNSKRIARNIYSAAKKNEMKTTFDLKKAVEKVVNPRFLTKSLSRVFQAIRIHVNDELNSLKEALSHSEEWLKIGGRIAIISFHSLEDRIIKHFFLDNAKSCICPREYPICICETKPKYQVLSKKAIIPSEGELRRNPRSRSAKLRAAIRI